LLPSDFSRSINAGLVRLPVFPRKFAEQQL
jgi:hypothetical protein